MAKEWENQSYCHLVLAKAKNLTIWQHDHIFRINVPIDIFTYGIVNRDHCAVIMQKKIRPLSHSTLRIITFHCAYQLEQLNIPSPHLGP